jgi:hypothetical protein
MKAIAQWLIITVLTGVYLVAFMAMLHPKVSAAYKSYYIDHNASEWNPMHYPGTPEQGISFGREGLPEWVDSTFGLSFRDPMGRWTDRNIAKIPAVSFTRRFNGPTCVEFTAAPAPALAGRGLAIRMGDETKTVPVVAPGFVEYRVAFVLERGADKLEFLLPEKLPRESEVDRSSNDTRRLGLSLNTLKILPGSCVDGGVEDEIRPKN